MSVDLSNGQYQFFVRACTQAGFSDATCGGWSLAEFSVDLAVPSTVPLIVSPTANQTIGGSTSVFEWRPVEGATAYEVLLTDVGNARTALRIVTPGTSTTFTMNSSYTYLLQVGACMAACNTESAPGVAFRVILPPKPAAAPTGLSTAVSGNSVAVQWNPVSNADLYRVQVVQPNAGPGGGALSVAARQTATPGIALPVPAGSATVLVQACNGDGCGPTAATPIAVAGPNPSVPNVGTPMAVINAEGPEVLITWSRIPGDNGSNTTYRLYVGDLSLDAPALDVETRNNFHAAKLRAEGRRYDALVFATRDGATAQGPASGFMVVGASASAPTMSSPTHGSTFRQGVKRLRWSPVTGAVRYQYYVARQGEARATVSGVTPGLFVDVTIPAAHGQPTGYNAIVRACPAASASVCAPESDAGWGPWSATTTGTLTFSAIP